MVHRVDYLVAIILAGYAVGVLFGGKASRIAPARMARGFLVTIVAIVVFRGLAFVGSVTFSHTSVWNTLVSGSDDAGTLLVGALVGLASHRTDRRAFLCDPSIYSALCLFVSVGFVVAGVSKAFALNEITEFFTQSGYSMPFVKFIITTEVLGAVALLLPWAVLPTLLGLSIDMFRAIYTHIHNGDPINDSTGAVDQLIRFGVIVVLWAWRPRADESRGAMGRRFVAIGMCTALCIIAAVTGGTLLRRRVVTSVRNETSVVASGCEELVMNNGNEPRRCATAGSLTNAAWGPADVGFRDFGRAGHRSETSEETRRWMSIRRMRPFEPTGATND